MNPACWSWTLPTTDAVGYADLVAWQGGLCAVCGRERYLVRDHDHETGWIRALLCESCNSRESRPDPTGVFARYREHNPCTMLGLQLTMSGSTALLRRERPESPLDGPVMAAVALVERTRQETADALARTREAVLTAIANGMTPTEAINLSGVSRRTVYSWINGENNK